MTEHKDEAMTLEQVLHDMRACISGHGVGHTWGQLPKWIAAITAAIAARDAKVEVTDAMCDRLYRALPLFCANITKDDARAALEAALAKESGK